MAYIARTPPMEKFIQLINPDISTGVSGEQVYCLPIFLRRDGVAFKLGYIVKKSDSDRAYVVREILMREDLSRVTVVLSPIDRKESGVVSMKEEILVSRVEDVTPVKGRMVALSIARDGMKKVVNSINAYPRHIQRVIRKHQLSHQIRTSVQKFLAGFSLARSTNIGCVDWRLDPGLLGLERDTDFSLEYRVERYVGGITSHLDLLLGDGWDVMNVGGGFRVIMTLELVIDINQQIRLNTHATFCKGDLDENYRIRCVEAVTNNVTPAPRFQLFSSEVTSSDKIYKENNSPEKFESLQSNKNAGVSLDWEEFQESTAESILDVSTDSPVADPLYDESSVGLDVSDSVIDHGSTIMTDLDEAAKIQKLLDTPTKGYSQIVFNVSTKNSGEMRSIDSLKEDHYDSFVSSEKDVLIGNDDNVSFETLSDAEKPPRTSDTNYQSILNEKDLDLQMLEEDENTEAAAAPNESGHFVHEINHLRNQTSTPDRGRDQLNGSSSISFKISTSSSDNYTSRSSKNDNNDTLENLSDLTTEAISSPNSCRLKCDRSPLSNELSFNDYAYSRSDEDLFSEDYRVSSSNGNKHESLKSSSENDIVLPEEISSSVATNMKDKSRFPVIASPQSSVTKVVAYVQSLNLPHNDDERGQINNVPEMLSHRKNLSLDVSINEDDANNSLASSRSRASRQSDLTNLTGRVSIGIGGLLGFAGQTNCPFPDDWQFNTIPETIENDDDVD